MKNIFSRLYTLPEDAWRGLLSFNRTVYPTEKVPEWRSEDLWLPWWLPLRSYPRVHTYYDHRFRAFVAGLITKQYSLFGVSPSSKHYPVITGLFLRLLWLLGSGYRFFPSAAYRSFPSAGRSDQRFPVVSRGFFDVFSPLAIIFRIFYLVRFTFVGLSELHYLLNPTFFLYHQPRDFGRLPFPGRVFVMLGIDKGYWQAYGRKGNGAFESEDEYFFWLSLYYNGWRGRFHNFLRILFYTAIFVPFVFFHLFLRTPIWHLFYWWSKLQMGWASSVTFEIPGPIREIIARTIFNPIGLYWDLFVAHSELIENIGLFRSKWWFHFHSLYSKQRQLLHFNLSRRVGLWANFASSFFDHLPRLFQRRFLRPSKSYRTAYNSANRIVFRWVRAQILTRARRISLPNTVQQRNRVLRLFPTLSMTATRGGFHSALAVLADKFSNRINRTVADIEFLEDTAPARIEIKQLSAGGILTEAFDMEREAPIVLARFKYFQAVAYRYLLNSAAVANFLLVRLYRLRPPRLIYVGRLFVYGFCYIFGFKPTLASKLYPNILLDYVLSICVRIGNLIRRLARFLGLVLKSFFLRILVLLQVLPRIGPLAAADVFSPVFSVCRSLLKATLNYREFFLAKKNFRINHTYGVYDNPVLYDDDEAEIYSQNHSDWFQDPLPAETEISSTLDNFDGAFSVAELYSPGDLDEDDSSGDASSVDYYLNVPQHSPLIDHRINPDYFEDDNHQTEAGFGYWFFGIIMLHYGIHSWLTRWPNPSVINTEDYFYFNDKKAEDVWAFEAPNQMHTRNIAISMGPDRGGTDLTVAAFNQLMRFSSQYKRQLGDKVANLPRSSIQYQLDAIRRTLGVGSHTSRVISKLSREDWLELTLFIDSIVRGNSAEVANKSLLSRSDVKRIWDRFADRSARMPQLIFQRIISAPHLPAAFNEHIIYTTNVRRNFPFFDYLARWLFGSNFRSLFIYKLLNKLFRRANTAIQEIRLQFLGDARALRLVYLYCSGLLPPATFDSEFSRLHKSPQVIHAIATYLRRLAVEDFEAVRRMATVLPQTASFFSLFCLSIAPISPAPQPNRYTYLTDYLSRHLTPIDTNNTSVPAVLGGIAGWHRVPVESTRNRGTRNRYQLNLLPTRHPFNVLPYFFIADFFQTLLPFRRAYRFLRYKNDDEEDEYLYDDEETWDRLDKGYNRLFNEYKSRGRYKLNKWKPQSDEDKKLMEPPEPLHLVDSEFGPIIDPDLQKILEAERTFVFTHRLFHIERLFFPKKLRYANQIKRYRKLYLRSIWMQRATTRSLSMDINELHTSAVVSPFLRFFTEVQAANAIFSATTPPQLINNSNFLVTQGIPFEDSESDLLDLYDEPLSVVFQTYELSEEGPDAELDENAPPFAAGFLSQLHEEDEDNYGQEYNNFPEYVEAVQAYASGDTEAEHFTEVDIATQFYGKQAVASNDLFELESPYFFERSTEIYRLSSVEEEEWQQDRFELGESTSVPLSRLFLGGLPTRGSFPATDPRLFLGPLTSPGVDTSLHYTPVFAKAKAAATSTSLVPVGSSLPDYQSGVLGLLSKAFFSAFLKAVTYVYLLIRDLLYAHWMQTYSNQKDVRVAQLHITASAHYYRWQEIYANKYYFRRFADALHHWTTDFEAYLSAPVRTDQYRNFRSHKAFTLVENIRHAAPFTRFFQMFPFRSFLFGPDGYHIEHPGIKEFPYQREFYLMYWYRRYHQRHFPDLPYEVTDREILELLQTPVKWIHEGPLLEDQRHFWPPNQMDKWSIYERTRFASFFDLPNSGDLTSIDYQDTVRTGSPFGGWFAVLKPLNWMPRWATDFRFRKTYVRPAHRSFTISDDAFNDDALLFQKPNPFDFTGGDIDSFFADESPMRFAHLYNSAVEVAAFADPEDASLFSYVTEADLSYHVDEFKDRAQILWLAFWDFLSLVADYTIYGTGLFVRTYVWGPFHYWVVYSDRFWLGLTLRVGSWVNIFRYLVSGTLFLGLYLYLFFAIPPLTYYWFAETFTTGWFIMLNGLVSLGLLLFLPYLFFNPVYRYYHSLWTFERLAIVMGVLFVYFEYVFYGYRPAGERLGAIPSFPGSMDEPHWREYNLDYFSATVNGGYEHIELSGQFYSPWHRRAFWRFFDMSTYFRDDVNGLWPYRQYFVDSTYPKRYFASHHLGDEYWNRHFSVMHTDWELKGRLLPDLLALYHVLRYEYFPFQTDFFTGRRALRILPQTAPLKIGAKDIYDLAVRQVTAEQTFDMAGDEMEGSEYIDGLIETGVKSANTKLIRRTSTYYAHPQKILAYHRYPVSPIHGINYFFGESRLNAAAVTTYDFRPTSFVHDPFYTKSNSLIDPGFTYNQAGQSPRDRNREIRVPDFVDLMADDELDDEQEEWMVDVPLVYAINELFGDDEFFSEDPNHEPDYLYFYDPDVDGNLHILVPQAHFSRPDRVETFDEINLELYDLDPDVDAPIERDADDIHRVGADTLTYDIQLELLTGAAAKTAQTHDSITVDYPGVEFEPGEFDAVQDFYFFSDLKFYDRTQQTPVTDIEEAQLPAAEVLTTRLDQSPFLYDRYFTAYLAGDWNYHRSLLNRAYTITSADNPLLLAQYYHFTRAQSQTAHFMDYYAKNLRDYLLYFKPESAYAFSDIYGPDQRLRFITSKFGKKNRWHYLVPRKARFEYQNFDFRAYSTNPAKWRRSTQFPYWNRSKPSMPPELGHRLVEALYNKGEDFWTFHDFSDLALIAAAEELSWLAQSKGSTFNFGRKKVKAIATAADSLRRWGQFSAQAKRFSDFHYHRGLVPNAYPNELIQRSVAFDASLFPPTSSSLEGRPVLDPFHRALQDCYPELRTSIYSSSATSIPRYLSHYGYGHTYTLFDSVATDPLTIYDYYEDHPFYTFPSTVDRYGTIYHSFVFDSDDVYAPIYEDPEEFIHFVTYPDLDDDYLAAIDRYEANLHTYLDPSLAQVTLGGFQGIDFDREAEFIAREAGIRNTDPLYRPSPRLPFPKAEKDEETDLDPDAEPEFELPDDLAVSPYVNDQSVEWQEMWAKFPYEEVPRSFMHFNFDLYPIRAGGVFDRRDLSAFRNVRRLHQNPFHKKKRKEIGLFFNLRGLENQLYHRRREAPEPEKFDPMVPPFDFFVHKSQLNDALTYPVRADRLMAIADYNRVHSLNSVYFSEYRKLLPVDPTMLLSLPGPAKSLSLKRPLDDLAVFFADSARLVQPYSGFRALAAVSYPDDITDPDTFTPELPEIPDFDEYVTAQEVIDALNTRRSQRDDSIVAAFNATSNYAWLYDTTSLTRDMVDEFIDPPEEDESDDFLVTQTEDPLLSIYLGELELADEEEDKDIISIYQRIIGPDLTKVQTIRW